MELHTVTTTYQGNVEESKRKTVEFTPDSGVEMPVVNLYPQITYQTFEGFGGAFTEAAGYAYSQMSAQKREEIVNSYFGPDGLGYRFARISVDSCDFALGHYEADSDPDDVKFEKFSLVRDEQYVQPLLRAAETAAGEKLGVMLSPWSPPAYMKTTGQRNGGGKLKPEYADRWAEYLCRYIEEYRKRGFDVRMLTIQNEPKAAQTWDSCEYTAEEEKAFLRDHLYPAMQSHGLTDIEVCIWDHNKERCFERAEAIIDKTTDPMVAGVCFHWYSGDHFDTLRLVRERYPDKKLVFSEGCVEYSRFHAENQLQNAQMYAHDILGNLNAGMNCSLDWNILLDEKGGPNHVQNYCDAPMMCDLQNDTVEKKLSFTYIGHFSKWIRPGAQRIACSTYTDRLEVTAFRNPDGALALVMLNRTEEAFPVSLRLQGQTAQTEVPANSIVSGIIRL
jgi:glucosylceramidase